MKTVFLGFLVLALATAGRSQPEAVPAPAKPVRPIPAIERVVIVGIDGLRPDRLLLADAPVLRGLLARGAYSMWMQTTALATTLPSFTSMLTGVGPRKHKIEWNDDLPLAEPVYPRRPTLFELARQAGYTTALVAGKAKFKPLAKPGTLDSAFVPADRNYESDEPTADEAVRLIRTLRPEVLFVHLPGVDAAGHAHGWGSPEQLAAINRADTQVGRVLAALGQAGLLAGALVIVSADHGGAGRTHGPDDPRSRTVPWIAAGPGVSPGCDLTQYPELHLRVEDTTATACFVLGLPQPDYFDGQPVRLAFTAPAKE